MKFNHGSSLLKKLSQLIEVQKSGTLSPFPHRLDIPQSQFYVPIDGWKLSGAEIKQEHQQNTFLSAGNKGSSIEKPTCAIKTLTIKKIGSMYQLIASVLFSGRNKINLVGDNYRLLIISFSS